MTNLKDTKTDEGLKQLMEELKKKMRRLKEYGMSEKEILSSLHTDQQLPQLIITRNYRIFLGDEHREVHFIYNKVRPWGLTDRALKSIEDVTNPMLNSINEKCARIRRTFVSMLDSSVAEQYYIKGARGKAKKITLSRELVAWE